VNLDLGRFFKADGVEDPAVVLQLGDTSSHHIIPDAVDEDELVGMHGDPEALLRNEAPDSAQLFAEVSSPIEGADRMRGKGDEIGANPEKEKSPIDVVPENCLQTVQIVLDGPDETIFRVGGEAEGRVGRATDAPIDAGIPDSHRLDLRLLFFAPA
jgi:hypothetical protein